MVGLERLGMEPVEHFSTVMPVPGLVPGIVAGIHVFLAVLQQDVDGRDKPDKRGHDAGEVVQYDRNML
jgi:hypothetical protein